MPRLCLLIALGAVFVTSVVLNSSAEPSSLLWWQKTLYALVGGALALLLLRVLPVDARPAAAASKAPADREQPRN
jgi:hypothetical protein